MGDQNIVHDFSALLEPKGSLGQPRGSTSKALSRGFGTANNPLGVTVAKTLPSQTQAKTGSSQSAAWLDQFSNKFSNPPQRVGENRLLPQPTPSTQTSGFHHTQPNDDIANLKTAISGLGTSIRSLSEGLSGALGGIRQQNEAILKGIKALEKQETTNERDQPVTIQRADLEQLDQDLRRFMKDVISEVASRMTELEGRIATLEAERDNAKRAEMESIEEQGVNIEEANE